MITWSECHIDWSEDQKMRLIRHEPTGIAVEPSVSCDGLPDKDGNVAREVWLVNLNDAVEASKT